MSRIGKRPIDVPSGVEVKVDGRNVTVKGTLGTLEQTLPAGIEVAVEGSTVSVTRKFNDQVTRSFHGLIRSLLANHVKGVAEGYSKRLEIVGVSYQASATPQAVTLKVGYANELVFKIPEGVIVELPNNTAITVKGPDKQKVGQFAAELRAARPPEPYKGKGVRYRGEHIVRKQGKSFVGTD